MLEEALNDFVGTLNQSSIDPREGWALSVRAICRRELALVPGDIAEHIVRSRLRSLNAKLAAALASGHFGDGADAIAGFATELRQGVLRERQEGRLQPASPDREVETWQHRLTNFRWGGIEIDGLRGLLKPGEHIVSVGWRSVTTDKRSLGRQTIQDSQKPAVFDPEKWSHQFVSDRQLAQFEADASAGAIE